MQLLRWTECAFVQVWFVQPTKLLSSNLRWNLRSSEFLSLVENLKTTQVALNVFIAQDATNLFIEKNCSEVYVLTVPTAEHLSRNALSKIPVEFFHILTTKSSSVSGLLSLHFFVVVVVLLHLCFLSPTQRVPNSQTFIWNMSQDKQPRSRGSTACIWGGGMVAVFCSLLGTAEFWSTSKVFSANEQCSKMSTDKRHCFFINPEEGWLHNPRSSNFFPLFTLQLCKDRYCVRAKKRLFLQTLG